MVNSTRLESARAKAHVGSNPTSSAKIMTSKALSAKIVQNVNQAIYVMRDAGKWLLENNKNPSKWWSLKNLNRKFLLQYAKPDEFYVALINNEPAAAAILQFNQKAQDWKSIDGDRRQPALYIHWLCVHRKFADNNLTKIMVNFASTLAQAQNINLLRVDTNAEELKLRKIYEGLDFQLADIKQEDYRKTAFYQKSL